MGCYCGIDLGTSGVKVLVIEENGSVADKSAREYDVIKNSPKEAEQDMEYLWQRTKECIGEITGRNPGLAERILGIGFSGQMHGLVALDEEDKPVANAIIWADQRSAGQLDGLYRKIPEMEFKECILNTPAPGFLLASLLWMREMEPERFSKTRKVMLPKDYIRLCLCGETGTDVTDASATGIFETGKRQWAYDWMERMGFSKDLFPDCRESWEVAGEVTEKAAAETGLKKGTKVVYGGGDSMMQLTGNGILAPGVLSCNIGTASQMVCAAGSPVYDRRFRTNTFCHVEENLWEVQGSSLTGGAALKWLKDRILFMDSFEQMEELASIAVPGCDGLLFLPYLNGERCPHMNPDARGIYHGLSLYHSREHLIRSTMEGILFGLRESLEIFREMGITYYSILSSGGGAKGGLFRQMQADIFDGEVYTSTESEQACVGAAICAAVGTKAFSSYEEACRAMTSQKREGTEPILENVKRYEEVFVRFKELYPTNKELFS